MSKAAKKSPLTRERKKLYALGGLLGVLFLISIYNFWPESRKPAPAAAPAKPRDGRVRATDLAKQQKAGASEAEDLGPAEELPLISISTVGVSGGRNLFAYPPPPPPPQPRRPPPPVQPPPPPISVGSITPSNAIAGTSKSIPITVMGSEFQRDFQIYWDGRPLKTEVVGESMLRATVQPSDIASPRAVRVEVKSASQPDRLWSRNLTFQLQPGPDPSETFVYTGRIGGQAVISFKGQSKRPALVSPGDTINGSVPWKILSVDASRVEMLDTRNEIRKTLALAPKGSK